MTRIVGYNLLKTAFVLYVGTILLTGCGSPAESKSSEANISVLTLTIGGKEYLLDFVGGNTAMIELPTRGNTQETVTVASVTLSAGATGVAQGDILPVSNGQISITVTAEDGTTSVDYTITLSAAFQVASIPKSNDDTQRRFHYVLFNISSLDSANDGRYKLALKAQGTAAPTVQEITDGVGVWRRLKAQTKRVMLSYTIDSNIKTFTESNLGKTRLHGGGVEGASDGSTYNIDSMFLRPGLSYTLYAFKEGGSSVLALEDFSTDVFDANATWPIPQNTFHDQDTFHDTVFSGEFTYSADDPVFIFPIAFLGYNVTYDVNGSDKISVFRLAFHTGKLTLSVGKKETFLVPSEGTDGTRYLSLDSRDIALGYLALPQSWLGTGQSLTLAGYSNLAEITLVEDQ